ncbi:MAG: hypothetical protein IPM77_11355 [Crocinitomicaceae bacterium]|nr:hypothetical protein [Crocinitomicaceae bacterium]
MILETSNAGETWQTNYFPDNNYHIRSLDLLNENLGFAVDENGNVIIYQ